MSSTARIALIVGAAAFAVADLIRRIILPDGLDTAGMIDAVSSHSGAWLVAGLLALAAPVLMLPGIAGATRAVTERGRVLTRIGGAAVILGLLAAIGHAVAFYGMAALYARTSLNSADAARFEDASNAYPLFVVLIVLFIVGLLLGPILLTLGLRRARTVQIWVPVVAIIFGVSGSVGGVPAGVVGVVAALATFVPIAVPALTRAAAPTTAPPAAADVAVR